MAALKRVQTPDACCTSTPSTLTYLDAPLWVELTKYWTTRLTANTTFARFVLSNLLGNQMTSAKKINNQLSTIKTKKINKPIAELFNVRSQLGRHYSGVIDNTPHWKDARKTSGFTDLNHSDLI